ncbi:MAG TPA: hypothetical protein DC054_11355 [Blastocatellia bacterium]|nr:hypothetical protein [Blastocatellia bacterium]
MVGAKRKPPDSIEKSIRTLKGCSKALEISFNCQSFTASNPSSRVTPITHKAHLSSKAINWSAGIAVAIGTCEHQRQHQPFDI